MSIIEVTNLTRTFTSVKKEPGIAGALKALVSRQTVLVEAVKDVSFSIESGEMVGFLGPNGAGKTTTLKMLSGILHPTSGDARVLGFRPWERNNAYLRQISLVMGQKNQLWWDLPAVDSFLLLKEIYDVSEKDYKRRLDELTALLDIGGLLDTQVRKLSLGERMKCELVAALIYAPRVVYLDEPTIGLDIVSQKRIREFLKLYQQREESTIILTSHYMQDIQELCARVVIIHHGAVIFDNTLESLVASYSHTKLIRLVFDRCVDRADLAPFGKVVECDENRATLEVPRASTTAAAAEILTHLPVADISIDDAEAEEIIRQIFTAAGP
ncbi:MAG: ATP-binding cassette domain-containing protein [Capsulimonadaceae bacterium]